MKKSRVEIINPCDQEALEKLDSFCRKHNLPNRKEEKVREEPYLFHCYFSYLEEDEIKDYCFFHGESDMRRGFLLFPPLDNDRTTFLSSILTNTLGMGLDTIFVSTKEKKMKHSLEKLGFLSLATGEEEEVSYVYEVEEKGLDYETFKAK